MIIRFMVNIDGLFSCLQGVDNPLLEGDDTVESVAKPKASGKKKVSVRMSLYSILI